VTYATDDPDKPKRLTPVNVNSLHYNRPKCWAKWAREMPPVGHNHLDPPERPQDRLTPEKRREVTRLGGLRSRRTGIRPGFGGHKHLQDICDAKAFQEGRAIVSLMVEKGLVDKDAAGNEALAYAVGVVRGEHSPQTKLQAARLVMDYTLAKPAQKQDVTLKAEDFLAELAKEAKERSRDDATGE
jgi:hypothetical protein